MKGLATAVAAAGVLPAPSAPETPPRPHPKQETLLLRDFHPASMLHAPAHEFERTRQFFEQYQDRILFGTDMTPEEGLYRNVFRYFQTADEHFDYWGAPEQGRWKIYGLELPGAVLEKVYHSNAERIFGQFKGV